MLTIVESDSSTWIVVATGGELRIYSRDQPEEWSEVVLSDDSEEVEEDKALMLEELYLQRTGNQQGDDGFMGAEDGSGEDEDEDEEDDEDEDEPELEEEDSGEDEEGDEDEDEAEEKKPARRGRASASEKRGRASSRQK